MRRTIISIFLILNAFLFAGCDSSTSVSSLNDESGDIFSPIKESDFDPIPEVTVEPYVDAVKDLCVEGCYDPNNPKIDWTWNNSRIPGNRTVSDILGGNDISNATKNSIDYNPYGQGASFRTPGTSDSTKPTKDNTGKTLADMEIQQRQQENERRNQEAKKFMEARELHDDLQAQWVKGFDDARREVGKVVADYKIAVGTNSANASPITSRESYKRLAGSISSGQSSRQQAQQRIEASLPKVEIKVDQNVNGFKTDIQTIEGMAVRRAESYVNYAKRTIENPSYPTEGRQRARELLADATNTLDFADTKYAAGQTRFGDKALEVTYALADMAIAIAPLALYVAFPQAAIVAIGAEAFVIAKSWYEFRSGKRIYDGSELSPFQKDMALVNVAFGFIPAAAELGAAVFSTGKSALVYAQEILSFGRSADEVAEVSRSASSLGRIVNVADEHAIRNGQSISSLGEAIESVTPLSGSAEEVTARALQSASRNGLKSVDDFSIFAEEIKASKAGAAGEFDATGRMVRNESRSMVYQDPGSLNCGPATCGMVLDTYGKPKKLVDLIAQVGDKATTGDELVALLKSNSVNARRNMETFPNDLERLTAGGRPVIARVATNGDYDHWIVVDGITIRNGQKVVAIRDPAPKPRPDSTKGGPYYELFETFKARYTREAIIPNNN
ncbi:cysteine peptidase family C39 domain-containing protein [Oligoflexus tunisiensis]|uniref:cysteine peptidase family C39 domain-containing protein n=1 Tax=Oligoflexus tunisiensis TaxID=708132 RepID=UPI00114D2F0B|nr:cysteine peptidase family C39 domain-containing protein [Oligoflexus tunisiensis]